jgi:hypothetical protein
MKSWMMIAIISIFAVIGLVLIIIRPDTTDDDAVKPNSFGADDKVKAGTKLTPDFSWMKMDVVGIDSARHQIEFKVFADDTETYSVSLYSEPPTQHSKDLEDALLGFTEKTLGCKNSKVAHVDNPAGAKDLYDRSLGVTEGWFQQAAGIQTTATPVASTK